MNSTVVSLSNVTKSFHQGERQIQILKNLNLEVAAGESLAILGQSGSGKTTLLTLIAGLDRPDGGDVKVLGRKLDHLSEDELAKLRREDMSIVFQQFHLFRHLTALENVLLPLEIAAKDSPIQRAQSMLTRVGLSHRLDHYPGQLSGGECQRLAIARALVVDPKVLLADEPSGNLDQATGAQVMDLMFQLVKENHLTLILVTHNKELADRCDKRFFMTQ
jgi:putative ABC transport system ATP-binding protein